MRNYVCGVTLLEVLVSLAVLAVFASLGVPALADMWHAYRTSAYADRLASSIRAARSEALRRNQRVTLCTSNDGEQCSVSGNWSSGWLVFADSNSNAQRDAGEEVILQANVNAGWMIQGNQQVRRYVSYTSQGYTRTISGALQMGRLTVCRSAAGAVDGIEIVLNHMGRPRMQKVSLAACQE